MLPTVLAAAGLTPARPMDGTDLLPHLTGQRTGRPHDVLHWRMAEHFAVRRGDWKYVHDQNGDGLFNLAVDVREATDLRSTHPRVAAELLALHRAWLKDLPPRLAKQAPVAGRKKGGGAPVG